MYKRQTISNITFTSSNDSILIKNPVITSSGATVDLTLSSTLSNLNSLEGSGLIRFGDGDKLDTINIISGDQNVGIDQSDNEYQISLNQVATFDSVQTNILKTNNISNIDSDLSLSSNENTIKFNDISVSKDNEITGCTFASFESISSPNSPKAWCRFSDTSGQIAIVSQYNISSVKTENNQYILSFAEKMLNTDYNVSITCSNHDSNPPIPSKISYDILRTLESVTIVVTDSAGELISAGAEGLSVVIYSN